MGFETDAFRGVLNRYGPRTTDEKFGGQSSSDKGIVKEAIWEFSYNDLPTYGASGMQFTIPANATIVSAKLIVDNAFTSTSTTTDLSVGLYTSAGVEIDADGLITAANADQTAINTSGKVITGTGALIGLPIGANAGELKVTASAGDLLTGTGRVVVEYINNR